ncbi:hypothetical protein ACFFWC_19455 [Plantactinospora siamensis]|uniref:Uncharacterized protein n=1 Tax=Plantactinospora siamensis TaxID=555372 RepID=A0ABV6P3M3_9ACTN
MAGLEFFVDVVVTGAVLGVGLADSPEQVTRVLGEDFVDDAAGTRLRRDYGLVEFFWSRPKGTPEWRAAGFTVAAHRLPWVGIAGPLLDRYGQFGDRLPFDRLRERLSRYGYRLRDITTAADGGDHRRFWLADSQTAVTVATSGWEGRLAAGDVWSIEAPWPPEQVAAGQLSGRRRAVTDGLAHLVRLGDADRVAWLDRRRPDTRDPNWWLFLLLVVDGRLGDRPGERPEWVTLKLWLLRQAYARGAFTRSESALRIAYLVAGIRTTAPYLVGLLPSADEVVADCLAAIPVGPDRVALLDDQRDLRRLGREQLLQSRQARNLVTGAESHLDHVHDQELAERLRRWLAVKPRLV